MTEAVATLDGGLRIVLLEGIDATASETLLAGLGRVRIDVRAGALSGDELRDAIAGTDAIGIRSRTRLSADLLERADRLLAIGCFCVGTNQVDLRAAALRGIPVFNAPHASTRSVAELVIGEIIMLLRRVPEFSAAMHAGRWRKHARGAHEVRGRSLGIVGYGHIGTQVGVLAEALGMTVRYYDTEPRLPLGKAKAAANLFELLAASDVVTLHVPATARTKGLMSAAALAAMPRGSILINASRAGLVDLDALVAAIESGRIAGAGIDVFPDEPQGDVADFVTPLSRFDNVILTPHLGGSTAEAQAAIGVEVATRLVGYLAEGSTASAVNFPEVMPPSRAGSCRLLHVHGNVPGVLAQLNEQLSRARINIAAQYLQTRGDIGYAITDVDAKAPSIVLERLRAVDGTIRCRVLP